MTVRPNSLVKDVKELPAPVENTAALSWAVVIALLIVIQIALRVLSRLPAIHVSINAEHARFVWEALPVNPVSKQDRAVGLMAPVAPVLPAKPATQTATVKAVLP